MVSLFKKSFSYAQKSEFQQILASNSNQNKLTGRNKLAKMLKSCMTDFTTSSSEWGKECIGAGTMKVSGNNKLYGASADPIPEKPTIYWEISHQTIIIKNLDPKNADLEFKDIKITSPQSDKYTHRIKLLEIIDKLKKQHDENQTNSDSVKKLIDHLDKISWFKELKSYAEDKQQYILKDDREVDKKTLEFLFKEYHKEYFDQTKFDALPDQTTFGAILDTLKRFDSSLPCKQLPKDDEIFISLAENLFGGDDSKINLPFYDIIEDSIINNLNANSELIDLCEAMKQRLQSLHINQHFLISTAHSYDATLINRINHVISTLNNIKNRRDFIRSNSNTSTIQDRFKTKLNEILLKTWHYKNDLKSRLLANKELDTGVMACRYAHNTGNDNGYHATERANDPHPITEVHTNQTPETEAAEFNSIAQALAGIAWSRTFDEKELTPDDLRNMKLVKIEVLDFLYEINKHNKNNPTNPFYLSLEQYKAFADLLGQQRSSNPLSKLMAKLRGGTTSLRQMRKYTHLQPEFKTMGAWETPLDPNISNRFSIVDIEAKLLTLSKSLQKNPGNIQCHTELKKYINDLIKNEETTQPAVAALLFRRGKLRFDLYSYVKNLEYTYNITVLDKSSEKKLAAMIYSPNPVIEPIKSGNSRYTKWQSILKDYSSSKKTKADILGWINQVSYQITHDTLMTAQQKSSLAQYLQDELNLERNGKFASVMEHGSLAPAIVAVCGIVGYGTFNWKRYFMFAHPYLSTILSPDALAIVEASVGISAWMGFSWLVPKTQDLKKGQTVTYNSIARRLSNMQEEINQVHALNLSKTLKGYVVAKVGDFSALTAKSKDLDSKEILSCIEILKASPMTACKILSFIPKDDRNDGSPGNLTIYNLLKYAKDTQNDDLEQELISLWQTATNTALDNSKTKKPHPEDLSIKFATNAAINNLSDNIIRALEKNDKEQIDLYSQILKSSPLLAYKILTKSYNKNSQQSLDSYFNAILQSHAPLITNKEVSYTNEESALAKKEEINISDILDNPNILAAHPPFLSLIQKTDKGTEKTYYFVASGDNGKYIKLNLAPKYIPSNTNVGLSAEGIAQCLENGEHYLLFPDYDFKNAGNINQVIATRIELRQTLKQLKTEAVSVYVNNKYTIQTMYSEIVKALEEKDLTNINFYLNLLNDDPLFAYHVLSTYDKDGTLLLDRLLQFTQKNDKDVSLFQQLSNYINPPKVTEDTLKLKELKALEDQLMTTWSAASVARFSEFTKETDLSKISEGEIKHTIRKFIAEYPLGNAHDAFTAVLLFKSVILTLPKEILVQQQAKTKSLSLSTSTSPTTPELTLKANRISSSLLKEFNTMLKNMRKDPTSKFYILRLISGKLQYFYKCLTRAFGAFVWAATVGLVTIPIVVFELTSIAATFGASAISLALVPQLYQLAVLPLADAARLTIYGIADSRYITHRDTKEYLRVQELVSFSEKLDQLEAEKNDDSPIKASSIIEQVNEQINKMYDFCEQVAKTSTQAFSDYAQAIHQMTPNIFSNSTEEVIQINNTPKSNSSTKITQYKLKIEDEQYVRQLNDIAQKYSLKDTKREELKKYFDTLTQELDKESIDKASAQQFQQRTVSIIKNSGLAEMEKSELLTHFAINWYYRAYRSSLIVSANRSVLMEKDFFIPNMIAGIGASFTTYFALPIFGLPYWCIPLIGGFGDTVPGVAPAVLPNLFYKKKGINNTTTYKACMDDIQEALHDCLDKCAAEYFPDAQGNITNPYLPNEVHNYGLLKSMLNILSLSNDRWYKNKMFTSQSQKKCDKYMQGFNLYEKKLADKYDAREKIKENEFNNKCDAAKTELKTISDEFIQVSKKYDSRPNSSLRSKSTPEVMTRSTFTEDPQLRVGGPSHSAPTVCNPYETQRSNIPPAENLTVTNASLLQTQSGRATPPPEYRSGSNTPPPEYRSGSNTPPLEYPSGGSQTPSYNTTIRQQEDEKRMEELRERLEKVRKENIKPAVDEFNTIKQSKTSQSWFANLVPSLSDKNIEAKRNKIREIQEYAKNLTDEIIRQTRETQENQANNKLSKNSPYNVTRTSSLEESTPDGYSSLIENYNTQALLVN